LFCRAGADDTKWRDTAKSLVEASLFGEASKERRRAGEDTLAALRNSLVSRRERGFPPIATSPSAA
jgi:hypothetical protein